MKVWLVTQGEYSDMYPDAVFSHEEDAKAYAQHVGGDVTDPFELDCEVGPKLWCVELRVDTYLGSAPKERVRACGVGRGKAAPLLDATVRVFRNKHHRPVANADPVWPNSKDWCLTTFVERETEADAIKVATERFQEEFARAALAGDPYERFP